MPHRIIAIANHKGGVGKTTTTANVGAVLASMGKNVLLVDLDAQANLTTYYVEKIPEETIFEALVNDEGKLPVINVKKGLDIVPSSLNMATIDFLISAKIDRNELLKIRLEEVAPQYDYILLDCPPSLGIITTNALIAASDVVIPLTAEVIPVRGLKSLTHIIKAVQKRANPNLRLSGIVITRFAGRNVNKDIEEGLRETFGDIVFQTKIRENITISEAPNTFQDIISYSPSSHGAEDYISLTEEILKI